MADGLSPPRKYVAPPRHKPTIDGHELRGTRRHALSDKGLNPLKRKRLNLGKKLLLSRYGIQASVEAFCMVFSDRNNGDAHGV